MKTTSKVLVLAFALLVMLSAGACDRVGPTAVDFPDDETAQTDQDTGGRWREINDCPEDMRKADCLNREIK